MQPIRASKKKIKCRHVLMGVFLQVNLVATTGNSDLFFLFGWSRPPKNKKEERVGGTRKRQQGVVQGESLLWIHYPRRYPYVPSLVMPPWVEKKIYPERVKRVGRLSS